MLPEVSNNLKDRDHAKRYYDDSNYIHSIPKSELSKVTPDIMKKIIVDCPRKKVS